MNELNNKTFIGVYYDNSDLLDKIEELKLTGYLDDNIYVIAKNEVDVSILRSQTAADVHSAFESWTDRFIGLMSGENKVRQMMHDVGIAEEEITRYYEEVQHGGMLLYVDEGWAYSVYSKNEPFYTDRLSPAASKPPTDPDRRTDSFMRDEVTPTAITQKVQNFNETEPSYGGYEPLNNPVPPEISASDIQDVNMEYPDEPVIAENEITRDGSYSIITDSPNEFPRG
ncbi:general stress protein [Sporosarcina sp.]|uniref:general stress protein n=1 Tax=Sporosarcina sp. TaxID=49982 RepID=UPI00263255D0|nr:general stress protein [Sporosarcina sp.]